MKDIIEYTVKHCIKRINKQYGTKIELAELAYFDDPSELPQSDSKAIVYGVAIWDHLTDAYSVKLSRKHLVMDLDWMLEEIVPHEVAHLGDFWMCASGYDIEEIHNERWREMARYLGSTGLTHPHYVL